MLVLRRSDLSRQNFITLPNFLTYLRMASIPVIVALLTQPASDFAMNCAFLVYVLASLTDLFDGILARRRNTVTSVGKLLDPLADKLLTAAVLIMLIPHGKVDAWLAWAIVGREIIITGLRVIAVGQGLVISASRMGKNKMVSQSIGFIFLLPAIPPYQATLDMVGTGFLWVSLLLGYYSAYDYFINFYKEAKGREHPAE